MTHQRPAGEAMSREERNRGGRRGRQFATRPMGGFRGAAHTRRLVLARYRAAERSAARHAVVRRLVGIGAVRCFEGDGQKSRNLAADGRCVITTDAGDMHLIVEGEARRVRDEATLRRASNAFETIYGWPTVVKADMLDAEYGAPTSGGPPYDVYEIPTKAFGLPTDGESFTPTRWRFDR